RTLEHRRSIGEVRVLRARRSVGKLRRQTTAGRGSRAWRRGLGSREALSGTQSTREQLRTKGPCANEILSASCCWVRVGRALHDDARARRERAFGETPYFCLWI